MKKQIIPHTPFPYMVLGRIHITKKCENIKRLPD